MQEILDADKVEQIKHRAIAIRDLMDDPELEKIYAERLAKLKDEQEKRLEMQRKGHGSVEEVEEADFLEVVTKTPKVIVQFFHRDFERCKIMDKHLQELCKKYFDTRFIKISAPVRKITPRFSAVRVAISKTGAKVGETSAIAAAVAVAAAVVLGRPCIA